MSREELKSRAGKRGTFTATFSRFGTKKAYKGPPLKTALLVDVRNTLDELIADHLWFTVYKTLDQVGLEPGDRVQFKATPEAYKKGYRGRRDDFDLPPPEIDYCLKRPSHVRKLMAITRDPGCCRRSLSGGPCLI
jgi:hypothetical protein